MIIVIPIIAVMFNSIWVSNSPMNTADKVFQSANGAQYILGGNCLRDIIERHAVSGQLARVHGDPVFLHSATEHLHLRYTRHAGKQRPQLVLRQVI
jgi:hypothetical protein